MGAWKDRLRHRLPRMAVVVHDLAMVWVCWQGLHYLRYALQPTPLDLAPFSSTVAIVLVAQGLVSWRVGLYRGLWRFASVPDLLNIFKASVVGLLAVVAGLFFYSRLDLVSRAALLLYPFVLTVLLGAPRLIFRAWKDHSLQQAVEGAERVLILGAGQAGEALVRDLRRLGRYDPIGFLDDAASLRGTRLQGLPVLGRIAEVARIAKETGAQLLVIAMPSVDATVMRRVIELCEESHLPFRTVPRLTDVLEGRSLPGQLKEVAIEDLLGRQPRSPDWKAIRGWLGGRSVLVTGAGGSIGSELCRQCARHGAKRIALVEIDELALLTTTAELRRDFPGIDCVPVLGDCGDQAVIAHALKLVEPESVFHAAAYKQVPLLQGQLREAVRNNALATHVVAKASREANVGTFVLVSTDKAVDPVNVLGASKRLAEMACQALVDARSTRMVTVRFGNVLDSAGSVVPLFREQIRRGGPVTVTDPDVTRYFMTIPEACLLILQAASIGAQQAVYTLDMGEPVPIRVLAEQMIRLAGKQPGKDVAIEYIGLRPGERLHETLFHADERYSSTIYPEILQAEPRAVMPERVTQALERLWAGVRAYDLEALAHALREAVPEFTPVEDETGNRPATVVVFPGRRAKAR
ncbi:nucleoside-diphosphate sugar epimerase/dehydratase [Thermomonas sp. XSG]|jgi:FlaA1/EpsC-like NDP-sugar epimerase|uniref:polysaccharide biosynthesis protein n=1 Tax=Thermomonas sp. XSG TaxID=2771436 RepID=UPI00086DA19F|nr:nucleoside-diphosphate sugar epimerase/dehydratase [Thermomonas sp. XSG]ODU41857.1 MAG: multidrug MFS transporter [Xanthomonadaceae bacterium SCN 69-48]QNU13953.1 polysaccharide biosynthesis protein [Thermomonas sp. XSG]